MNGETRQQMIDRLIGDREKRIAAEAERYKDKRMDEPNTPIGPSTPGVVAIKFLIGSRVVLNLDLERQVGFVTGVTMRQCGLLYLVTWGDTRGETGHSDFELDAAGDDGPYGHAAC